MQEPCVQDLGARILERGVRIKDWGARIQVPGTGGQCPWQRGYVDRLESQFLGGKRMPWTPFPCREIAFQRAKSVYENPNKCEHRQTAQSVYAKRPQKTTLCVYTINVYTINPMPEKQKAGGPISCSLHRDKHFKVYAKNLAKRQVFVQTRIAYTMISC